MCVGSPLTLVAHLLVGCEWGSKEMVENLSPARPSHLLPDSLPRHSPQMSQEKTKQKNSMTKHSSEIIQF